MVAADTRVGPATVITHILDDIIEIKLGLPLKIFEKLKELMVLWRL